MSEPTPNKDQITGNLRGQAEALLSLARIQMADIQRALGTVVGDVALQSRLSAVASQISGAVGELSQVLNSPILTLRQADLMALEGVVRSSEAATLITEASARAGASAAQTQELATASAATRQEVQNLSRDLYERRIFDPYLHFSSPEDEAEFRKREAEERQYIEAQLARHTPEGDLNAAGGMQGTMLDAHAHGAGDSPDFLPRWDALAESTQKQRAAMLAAGQSTEEYDRHITASVRRFLKEEKHLSDAEIDERLARSGNPLDAVKPFLTNDQASRNLETTTKAIAIAAHTAPTVLPAVGAVEPAPVADIALTADFDPFAKLKAAGVQVTDTADSGHGISVPKPGGKNGLTVGS